MHNILTSVAVSMLSISLHCILAQLIGPKPIGVMIYALLPISLKVSEQ